MDIGKSLTFVTEDENWIKKLGIGTLVNLVPILNFAWLGYIVEMLRNVQQGDPRPLPEWEDFGGKFMKGLMVGIANLIYALPIILLACLVGIIPAVAGGSGGDADTLGAAIGGLSILLFCCIGLYGLILSFVAPAILINFSREGTFGSCFQFSAISQIITQNTQTYLTAWGIGILISLGVGIILGLVGWIPCIGWLASLAATTYIMVVWAHLFGQVSSANTLA
jgi:hypothetical protein